MRKRTVLLMCAAAVAMGVASPFLVTFGPPDAATSDGLFHTWFYALPTAVDQWLWPEEPVVMQLLAMAVLAAQYLGLFAAVAGLLQFAKVVHDFVRPHKHRRSAGSLMRRRA
jgi:hypothetical protein